jgi:hypothetical protein
MPSEYVVDGAQHVALSAEQQQLRAHRARARAQHRQTIELTMLHRHRFHPPRHVGQRERGERRRLTVAPAAVQHRGARAHPQLSHERGAPIVAAHRQPLRRGAHDGRSESSGRRRPVPDGRLMSVPSADQRERIVKSFVSMSGSAAASDKLASATSIRLAQAQRKRLLGLPAPAQHA